MSMPSPSPTSNPQLNQRRRREVEQIQRALEDQGPTDAETLRRLVGGTYWGAGRFDKALSWGAQKRLIVRGDDGRYHVGSD